MKTERECIDLKCTHWDGDRCTLGFCEPDILEDEEDKCALCGYSRLLCVCFIYNLKENTSGKPEDVVDIGI